MKRTWLASEGFSCCVARETRQEIVAHIRWQEPGCRCFAPKPLGWHGCIPMGNTPEWKLCAQLKLQEFSTVFSVRVMQYATRFRQRMLVNKTRMGEKCCSETERRYRYLAFCLLLRFMLPGVALRCDDCCGPEFSSGGEVIPCPASIHLGVF